MSATFRADVLAAYTAELHRRTGDFPPVAQ
jgi:hypothetical protein